METYTQEYKELATILFNLAKEYCKSVHNLRYPEYDFDIEYPKFLKAWKLRNPEFTERINNNKYGLSFDPYNH